MKTKKLEIKVKLNAEFKISAEPNLDNWNNADEKSKQLYVKDQVIDYIIDNIDDIINDLLEDSKIEF